MKDLKPIIANLLKPVIKVEPAYPQSSPVFPLCILQEIVNTSDTIIENQDRLSTVVYQLDVYDNGKLRNVCEQKAIEVNALMMSVGFARTGGTVSNSTNGVHRKAMRFSAKVDEKTLQVYRG